MNIVNEMFSDYQSRTDENDDNRGPSGMKKKPAWLMKVPGKLSMVIVLVVGISALSVFIIYPQSMQSLFSSSNKLTQGSTEGNVKLLAQRDVPVLSQAERDYDIGIDERNVVLQDEAVAPVVLASAMPPLTAVNPLEDKKTVKSKTETKPQGKSKNNESPKQLLAKTDVTKKVEVASKKIMGGKTPNEVPLKTAQQKVITAKIDKHKNTVQVAAVTPIKTPPVATTQAPKQGGSESAKVIEPIEKKIVPLSNEQLAEQSYQQAMQHVTQMQPELAKPLLEKALQLQSSHLDARKALIGILIENKDWEAAIKTLQAGLLNNPDSVEIPMWLGRVFLELGRNHEAIKVLESRQRYAKGNGNYYLLLAIAYQNSDKYSDAVDAYLKAIGDDAYKSTWWFGLATVFEVMEKWGDAYPAYQQAINTAQLTNDMNAYAKERMEYVRMQINLAAQMDD